MELQQAKRSNPEQKEKEAGEKNDLAGIRTRVSAVTRLDTDPYTTKPCETCRSIVITCIDHMSVLYDILDIYVGIRARSLACWSHHLRFLTHHPYH